MGLQKWIAEVIVIGNDCVAMRVLNDDLSDTKKSSTVHEFNHMFLK
ncbi:unknow [Vibrio campbellii]|nr:unknow [Vibrio campbellii]